MACETCTSLTAGVGQTDQWNDANAGDDYGAGSTEPGAASVNMSWTLGSSDHWAIGAVPIKPAAGGGGATWAAAEDTKLVGLAKSTPKRIRFEVSNEGTTSSGAITYELQVAETATCSAGVYATVPISGGSHWRITDSAFLTDGNATTNVSPGLTDEGSTFVPGEVKDAGNTTGSITLAADAFTELEFSVQANNGATDGGDYCFRLYDATGRTVLDTYSVYAEVSSPVLPLPEARSRTTAGATMTVPKQVVEPLPSMGRPRRSRSTPAGR